MLTVKSHPLELRGVATRTTKAGKTYYMVNTESEDGTPHALYCPEVSALQPNMRKGDKVQVTFTVSSYNGSERLTVEKVEKVS